MTGFATSRSEARFPVAKPAKRPRKPIRRKAKRKAKMHDADALFSQYIRKRDGWQCRACGSPVMPQCAHIVSRRYRATRWLADNAVTLCKRDHMRWTHDPLGWEAWVEKRFPARLGMLKAQALAAHEHPDFDALCESLRAAIGATA